MSSLDDELDDELCFLVDWMGVDTVAPAVDTGALTVLATRGDTIAGAAAGVAAGVAATTALGACISS